SDFRGESVRPDGRGKPDSNHCKSSTCGELASFGKATVPGVALATRTSPAQAVDLKVPCTSSSLVEAVFPETVVLAREAMPAGSRKSPPPTPAPAGPALPATPT